MSVSAGLFTESFVGGPVEFLTLLTAVVGLVAAGTLHRFPGRAEVALLTLRSHSAAIYRLVDDSNCCRRFSLSIQIIQRKLGIVSMTTRC